MTGAGSGERKRYRSLRRKDGKKTIKPKKVKRRAR